MVYWLMLERVQQSDRMPIDMPDRSVDLPGLQGGAVARRQATGAGIAPYTIRSRVRSGRWQRLQRGVYASFSGEPTRETTLWAALLRAGPGAVLSHQTRINE